MLNKRSVGILILFALFKEEFLTLKALLLFHNFLFLKNFPLLGGFILLLGDSKFFSIESKPIIISFETSFVVVLTALADLKNPLKILFLDSLLVSDNPNEETFSDFTDLDG